jgi:Tfp pilus assembly protein PilV
MRQNKRIYSAFALYEVLLGVTIFVIGVLALGRSVENCLNANALNEEENRVRQILANRMAEIQTAPPRPDNSSETKIDTGYGIVKLSQKSGAAELKDEQGLDLGGISRVTLTAEWFRQGVTQSKQIVFYVYRAG